MTPELWYSVSIGVGAVFGLTSFKYHLGESDRTGGMSRCGDEMMRVMLYEAAQNHGAHDEMVLAQVLGDNNRQAPRIGKGDRGFAPRHCAIE